MLRDIYSIPEEEPRYKENILEVTGELDEIIMQVDTTYNEMQIKQIIMEQIRDFIYLDGSYRVDVDVKFYKWDYNVAMVVDLNINNKTVAQYLV